MLSSFSRLLSKKLACGIEIGGQTAAICIADKLGSFLYKKKGIPTRTPVMPSEAVDNIIKSVKESGYEIDRIGIASFGPLDLIKGRMGVTPKPYWANFPIVQEIQKGFPNAKVVIETDVNAPAYSEYLALKEMDPNIRSVAYTTIGTGVGVGVFCDGKPLHGRMHPESGHLYPARIEGDNFKGNCSFHNDCYEGLISAIALAERLGIKPKDLSDLPNDHQVWRCFTEYAGQLAASMSLAYSLDVFVIGGGIVTAPGREFLIDKIQAVVEKRINNYIKVPKVILPTYGKDSGLVGASALALNSEIFEVK